MNDTDHHRKAVLAIGTASVVMICLSPVLPILLPVAMFTMLFGFPIALTV